MIEAIKKRLNTFFKLDENNTTIKTELLAGLTTFLTMSYIIFVNPQILSSTGMDLGAVFVATCIVTVIGSFLLGILANYPIAIAPGMALNVYFAFTIVQALGHSWQSTLGAVFISGILFCILTITRLRYWLIESIPESLNIGISVGIGIFIILLALKSGGIIKANSKTLITLGDIRSLPTALFILGFFIIATLDYHKVLGAILIGILSITLISILMGASQFHGIFALPPSIKPTLFAFNLQDTFSSSGFSIIVAFVLIALFDGTGTLVGLLRLDRFTADPQKNKKISRALFADSVATISGAFLGTSSTSPFIESEAGIRAGGSTGLTAITVAFLFLLSLFLLPLTMSIPGCAVAPALLYVGILMVKNVIDLNVRDFSEFMPSIVTAIMIPFSFSIADGFGLGLISYILFKLLSGQYKALNLTLIFLGLLFIGYFMLRPQL